MNTYFLSSTSNSDMKREEIRVDLTIKNKQAKSVNQHFRVKGRNEIRQHQTIDFDHLLNMTN